MEEEIPICEECDMKMHPFATLEGSHWVSGWSCDGCGWSWDTYREPIKE